MPFLHPRFSVRSRHITYFYGQVRQQNARLLSFLQNPRKEKEDKKHKVLLRMEDDWNLSMEELESLEQDALRKIAERQKSSSGATASSEQGRRVIPSTVLSSPVKKSGGQVNVRLFKDRPGRIALETQYNQHLVAMLKTVAGHEWDQQRRVWIYPEGELQNVEKALSSLPHIIASIHAVPPLHLSLTCRPAECEAGKCTSEQRSPVKFEYVSSKSSPCKAMATSEGCVARSPPAPKNSLVVQIYLIDQERIAARSPYNEKVKEACQSVHGRLWNAEEKVWTFLKNSFGELLDSLDKISSPSIAVEAFPPLVLPESWSSNISKSGQLSNSERKSVVNMSVRTKLWNEADPRKEGDSKNIFQRCCVNLFLHSSGHIAAKFQYQEGLVAAFRTIPKAEWKAKERLWMFPISSLADAERTLSQIDCLEVDVVSLDAFVRRALEAAAALPDLRGMYDNIPAFLENALLPFQRDGVRFVLEHGGRALIADEMGLGKTLQAIAVASCLRDAWPVLVITPSALRLQWALMINQWLRICSSEISVVMSQWSGSIKEEFNIVMPSGKHGVQLDGLFNIVSYDLVPKLHEMLTSNDYKIVIADESHYMKNAQAKRTDACIPLLQKAQYCILLTGTPALARPIELFKQLQALHPTAYKSIHEYGQRYCKGGYFGTYQGSSNHEELHALLKATVMIRRLKKQVLSELPVKRRQQIFLSLEEKGLQQMRALFFELGNIKRQMEVCKSEEEVQSLKYAQHQLINKMYTESAEVKIPAVLEYIQTVIEGGCKFLVFAHHLSMLDAIDQFLVRKKVAFIRIDGSTPASTRQTFVTKFQEREDIKVAVLAIRAAGVGLTLTAASTVMFAELSWTPGDLVQAEDRAHRIGQVSSVNVYYLHAKDTVDDLIWDAVQHKLENIGQVLDGQENALEAVSNNNYNLSKGQKKLDSFLQPCINNCLEGDKDSSSVDSISIRKRILNLELEGDKDSSAVDSRINKRMKT